MLRFEGIEIRQGDFSLQATLCVTAGTKVAVIGPSGAGKSTLLGALGGFVPIERGEIFWSDRSISSQPPGKRPISMLFQDNNLFPHLSVEQNVGLGLRPTARLTDAEKEKVASAIDRVGLQGLGRRKPMALSGGQQSRAALARVLVQNNPLVLLDEPFAALGPALRHQMLDLMGALMAETSATLLMVTHSPDDVMRIAEQVIFVEGGVAHPPAPAADLMTNPPPALRDYLG